MMIYSNKHICIRTFVLLMDYHAIYVFVYVCRTQDCINMTKIESSIWFCWLALNNFISLPQVLVCSERISKLICG